MTQSKREMFSPERWLIEGTMAELKVPLAVHRMNRMHHVEGKKIEIGVKGLPCGRRLRRRDAPRGPFRFACAS
jgi:hypothetical protein